MRVRRVLGSMLLALVVANPAAAIVSKKEAKKLGIKGTPLTPLGATRAGNEEGSYPEWKGGYKKKKKFKKKGKKIVNPFKKDKILYTITPANYRNAEYFKMLTQGQKRAFEQYPKTFKMNVYKSRRTAAYPKKLYKATMANARRVRLANKSSTFTGTTAGYPFPIPKTANEMMLNHAYRFAGGIGIKASNVSAVVNDIGRYQLEKSQQEILFFYNNPRYKSTKKQKGRYVSIMSWTTFPASVAGEGFLVSLAMDRLKVAPRVYQYSRGQKEKKVPVLGYDEGSLHEGLVMYDQLDMFNGPLDRYDWTFKGKREMLLPYNNYKLDSKKLKPKDMIRVGHLNPKHIRYERRRVLVVEANVKKKQKHLYPKRVFYIDEDSWTIIAQDIYDQAGRYWRYAEFYLIQHYGIPAVIPTMQVHLDFLTRQYYVSGMNNQERPTDYFKKYKESRFTINTLKRLVD